MRHIKNTNTSCHVPSTHLGLIIATLALAACHDDGKSAPRTYNVGGSIAGLTSGGLVLANGTQTVSPAANATAFTFPTAVASGTAYSVTVQTQPATLTCQVNSGSGTVAGAVTTVSVACTPRTYDVGGTVSGLVTAGLVLANGSETLPVAANATTFTLPTVVAVGASFNVTVQTQPSGQRCEVLTGSGSMPNNAVTSIEVLCVTGAATWESGSNEAEAHGVYGTRGVGSTANVPGGRLAPMSWRGASGEVWLFGGDGYDSAGTNGRLDDLWKYVPSTGEWTWVAGSNIAGAAAVYGTQGVAAPANTPGKRLSAATWTDSAGNLWLFGGARDGDLANDLWKFTVSTGEWTWVGGSSTNSAAGVYGTRGVAAPANVPGARVPVAAWTDAAGNLWLFGGDGVDSGFLSGALNDLWKYDPTTGQWTWVSGSNTMAGTTASYGTKGVAHAANVPGGRSYGAVSWIDAADKLWFFGGVGRDSVGTRHRLNDLWNYDPVSGHWTWVSGDNVVNAIGVSGTKGVANAANVPGARDSGVAWIDASGAAYLFSGIGFGPDQSLGTQSDFWKYDPVSNQWTWVAGPATSAAYGTYGVQGQWSARNQPGARYYATAVTDNNGRHWLFGGLGLADTTGGSLNDLWEFVP